MISKRCVDKYVKHYLRPSQYQYHFCPSYYLNPNRGHYYQHKYHNKGALQEYGRLDKPKFFLNQPPAYTTTPGTEEYLCVVGGKECISSILVFMWHLEIAGRCLTNASHRINNNPITEITETIDPILATMFHVVNVSGQSEYRRGMPANPKKCIGKNVILTPINISINCTLVHVGFIVKPTIKGNQLISPPINANTAPILNTQ